MLRALPLSLVAFTLSGCITYTQADTAEPRTEAPAFTGAVSAADPRAQAAGEEILARGGSATDAAIAVMLALTVVEPQSSGIGGGGFLVRGEAGGSVTTFDGRETAPSGATPDWFLSETGELPPFIDSVRSGLSVGVPGNIALAAKAHAAHGRLDWATLFEPAIRLAREGFRINPRLNTSLESAKNRAAFSAEGRALFFDAEGAALPVGTLVRNEALAKTFEALAARGPEAFYAGEIAQALATTIAADTPRDGAMTYADIASYEAKERDAVCTPYREYRICSMGPPTSGGVAVQQILGQLERFDLAALGADNPVTWHLFLEAQRLAYADREIYLADSDFVSVPVAGLLEPTYLAERSALISPDRSLADPQAGKPRGAPLALADGDESVEHGTSHFAVIDSARTMVSYTSTVEGPFGSGLMVAGFYLNNELTDFSRSPQVDGRLVANRVEGGKRPRSSMSPTVVYDPEGQPFMVVGAAGGSTIPVTTARAIIGAIDFGLSAEGSLGLPFTMAFGSRVLLEEGTWLETSAEAFRALGHEDLIIRAAPIKGGALLHGAGEWQSARDPRLVGQLELP
ncbi:gamma-glutamyltransferase [Qipengyuania aurantiaca]|uniref:Glutathione hydrolase proenzyme n=1 Tax=Qipengyuania aurantiaca TaxID=2867233 RepID=A0ABX8ZTC7_9SPHN|nr:gamma-glutamyltransferase [Qipengyuania aurantiaca]QZD90847.1 gamma-glutamyltransferase [Qipengyuania aurantiaca]